MLFTDWKNSKFIQFYGNIYLKPGRFGSKFRPRITHPRYVIDCEYWYVFCHDSCGTSSHFYFLQIEKGSNRSNFMSIYSLLIPKILTGTRFGPDLDPKSDKEMPMCQKFVQYWFYHIFLTYFIELGPYYANGISGKRKISFCKFRTRSGCDPISTRYRLENIFSWNFPKFLLNFPSIGEKSKSKAHFNQKIS